DQAAKLWLKLVIIAIGAFLSLLWIRMVRLPPFREVRHLWHQIETLQFMIVSDPKNRLDLLKRRVFADQARHFRGLAVYSYVLSMLSGLILDGLGFVRVSDFVVTIGWTLALMVL
ncbi:ABC transporter permease, partial [Lacticaseibacillus paracasei]|nr:ABC transporter permease [Lacticaseibacillus paracasei]